jgi:CRP-like cAMP-binding protein
MLPGVSLDKIKKIFYENGARITVPRKDIIVFQGDSIDDVFFVSKGIYKIYNLDQYGEERTISIVGRNNILPLSWQIMPQPKGGAFFFYEAYTDLVAYKMSQKKFKEILKKDTDLIYFLMDSLARSYVGLESRIQNLQKSKVEEKTEFVLYFLAKRLGHSPDGQVYEIKKHITQQDIADLAGINRETIARFLLSAQTNHLAWKSGSSYYIDVAKLHSVYKSPVYS